MNVEHVTIPIEPRTVSGCIDLGVVFGRRHYGSVVWLLGLAALPSLALTHYLARVTNHGLLWGLLIFYFASPVLGAWLAVAAGRRVFGEPFSARTALRTFAPRSVGVVLRMWWNRLLALLATLGVVGGPLVAARGASVPEVVLLEQLSGARVGRRLGELGRGVQTSPTMALIIIWSFGLTAAIALFVGAHVGSDFLFGIPLWFHPGDGFGGSLDRLTYDPVTVTTLLATLWLIYPVLRLSWFFVYLDQRIRNECWDVELHFRREARRLAP